MCMIRYGDTCCSGFRNMFLGQSVHYRILFYSTVNCIPYNVFICLPIFSLSIYSELKFIMPCHIDVIFTSKNFIFNRSMDSQYVIWLLLVISKWCITVRCIQHGIFGRQATDWYVYLIGVVVIVHTRNLRAFVCEDQLFWQFIRGRPRS